ncbi:FAD-dependent monooxygenase [Novosphingobium sediminicola]|uniref:2-polyprenyl-6-methoxyphenol hydroxylase-like FAD-dependent oxidoreductase n=1 Tax=Novosphingobium sediminicola TaxID=563162 RepID=A0A7W6CR29_9SPHN|nr:FAD-dependent monooxygenase [Novosphingobium sediminicola]MBB3957591.1 2-polyprenyl-6-methoxyphenol hydroxylase-like FAD-dependent oxidoreductase [Novosphingobium sediminicola]
MERENIRSVQEALIVGGGIGGMAAAIALSERGVKVDLIDLDPQWRVYGAGITITGPTLRAYRRLGLLEQIKAQGAITTKTRLFKYDGTHLHDLEEPVIEEGLPATGGIMRPVLHRIMQGRVKELGIPVRLGLTVSSLVNVDSGVDVTFSDGSTGHYDLVVGSDSVFSGVRELSFPHMGPAQPTGQGCWRISIRKPPGLEYGEFYLGHANPCGITACAPDQVYMWMLTPHVERESFMDEEELFNELKRLLADFGGNAGWIRDNMTRDDWINYRPLAAVLQPKPWYDGRIVLLGDAVHATTPHLASGAGMAVESGIVLAEELARADSVEAGLLAYQERRYPRCQDVIDSSVSVGRLQLAHGDPREHAKILEGALSRLNEDF